MSEAGTLCRSCQAPIIFAFTNTGKRTPVNAEPLPVGNIALDWTGTVARAEVLTGEELEEAKAGGRDLYLSHFAVCPDGHEWRGR